MDGQALSVSASGFLRVYAGFTGAVQKSGSLRIRHTTANFKFSAPEKKTTTHLSTFAQNKNTRMLGSIVSRLASPTAH